MTEADRIRFKLIAHEVLMQERVENGIGTLGEKRLHKILKRFLEENEENHEVKVGTYFADILSGNMITEIQTGSFRPLREKIAYYLENTPYDITVVRPLPYVKTVCTVERESGELLSRKKSTRRTRPRDVLRDWYYLAEFLSNPRFTLRFLLLEEDEYRMTKKKTRRWGKESELYERIPTALLDEELYEYQSDYLKFLPEDMPAEFTAAEYGKRAKLHGYAIYSALKLLEAVGLVEKGEKQGRSYIYRLLPKEK